MSDNTIVYTVGLVVPVLRNFKGLTELIASIDYPIYPLIVDNWADNRGVSKGWNEGLKRAIDLDLDFALVCNDDITLDPGTIEKLIDSVNSGFDLVTPINHRDHPGTEDEQYADCPDFACFMVKPKEVVAKVGWVDENFSPAYF